jgi:hypothetical protein
LGFLGCLSILSGYIFRDLFSGPASGFFNNSVSLQSLWSLLEVESLSYYIKVLPVVLLVLSFELGRSWLFECKWFYNEFVNFSFGIPVLKYGRHAFEQIEKTAIENTGPVFFYNSARKLLYR